MISADSSVASSVSLDGEEEEPLVVPVTVKASKRENKKVRRTLIVLVRQEEYYS